LWAASTLAILTDFLLMYCFTSLTKLQLLHKYPQRVLIKISRETLVLAEHEFRASRAGPKRPKTQPS
jgi:hypothetical protein